MCGRKTLTQGKIKIMEAFMADQWETDFTWTPSYNIAPLQINPILLANGLRRIVPMRWGLVPKWSQDDKLAAKMINARIETLQEKASFKNLLQANRCVVIADGYYEWQKRGDSKQPYHIRPAEDTFLPMAGLWTSWSKGDSETLITYTIITRPASAELTAIHERMPAVLTMENFSQWADCKRFSVSDSLELLQKSSPELLSFPVSSLVNSPQNNSDKCLEPLTNRETLF